MSHGDLTPGNVLVAGGHLAGVLDVGDFRAADPALDLISAWNLLADRPRLVLRDALRCTDLDWERGQAWAFQQAMGLVWYYAETNPVMSRLGRVTLDRIQSAGRPLPEPLTWTARWRHDRGDPRQAISRHRPPEVLPDTVNRKHVPYLDVDPGKSVWAATGYGAFSDDLVDRILCGDFDHRRGSA
jgi:hypothetical protein